MQSTADGTRWARKNRPVYPCTSRGRRPQPCYHGGPRTFSTWTQSSYNYVGALPWIHVHAPTTFLEITDTGRLHYIPECMHVDQIIIVVTASCSGIYNTSRSILPGLHRFFLNPGTGPQWLRTLFLFLLFRLLLLSDFQSTKAFPFLNRS